MAKKFIKLHSDEDNSVITQHIAEIIAVYTEVEDDKKTTIVCIDNETIESLTTNETPEKIYQIILDAKCNDFVKLHNSDDNSVIITNTNYISTITSTKDDNDKKCSIIYMNTDVIESMTFNESCERIFQLINNAEDTDDEILARLDKIEQKIK